MRLPIAEIFALCSCTTLAFPATGAGASPAAAALIQSNARAFIVFDALAYRSKPDLRSLGLREMRGVGDFWHSGQPAEAIDAGGVRLALRPIADYRGVYYIDIENWPVANAADDVIDRSVAKLAEVAGIARRSAPHATFGFYDILPQSVYWPFVLHRPDLIETWRADTARAARLADRVDYLFPSLYTFYNDPAGWLIAAREILKEARRYGKPVYPFLWPEFHDSNRELKGTYLPREFWRQELTLCRQFADGVVLWGGTGEQWDEHAAWWLETVTFLSALKVRSPESKTAERREDLTR